MILPALQKELCIFHIPELNGDFVEQEIPRFNCQTFYDGSFQSAFEKYLEQHIGFHNTLVRLKNQIDYSLFKKPNAEGIVIGKNNFLFEYDYIREITGRAYVGYDFIDEKLRRLQYVQDHLKNNFNTDFVIVFIPGKASFYQEYIPDIYLNNTKDSTNYKVYLDEIKNRGIKYINLNEYFLQIKESPDYPLFTKYGTHWSIYGMSRASHVLIDNMEQIKNKKLNDYNTDSLYFSAIPLRTDYDGGKALNLMTNLYDEIYAYPKYYFGQDSSRYKPKVLTIGDSFYWNIFNAGIPKNLFANETFWYYNNKVYPDYYISPKYTLEINLKEEVERMDFVFIMVTERFLNVFDWKLIDQLYYLYTPDYIKDPIYDYMNSILLDANWFNKIIREAVVNNIKVGDVLYSNAANQHYINDKSDFSIQFGARSYLNYVSNHKGLVEKLEIKASKENKSFYEVLFEEANYLFKIQNPKLYEIHKRILEKEVFIKTNDQVYDSVKELANTYYCKLNDMIFYQARNMVQEEDIQSQMKIILNDEEWTRAIQEKARKNNIPFQEMLRSDAIYMLNSSK
jgi:hypothetical protein